jgi:hypothetical protein
MSTWTEHELESFAPADDFHIAPLREDGVTYGTPTFIWSVVSGGDLYVRAYNGPRSRWYRAAMAQKAGRIRIAGAEHEVAFAPADDAVLDAVDDAYRAKYGQSAYLAPMIAEGPRSATVRVTPRR